jgi:CRP-like cAMP-binding protein
MSHCCDPVHSFHCITIVPIFSHLNTTEMAEVAAITTERPYNRGQYIYRTEERRDEMYVLHTGSVKIFRLTADGKEQVIRTVGPGEFFGELSLFSHRSQSDYAVALEDVTMCVIAWEKLKILMERIPSIAFKVMEQLSGRLEETESLLEQTNLLPVEIRLARYLLQNSLSNPSFTLPLSKGDLASLLGMTQETLSRRLSSFQQQGYIRMEGQRTINILDREGLILLSDEE